MVSRRQILWLGAFFTVVVVTGMGASLFRATRAKHIKSVLRRYLGNLQYRNEDIEKFSRDFAEFATFGKLQRALFAMEPIEFPRLIAQQLLPRQFSILERSERIIFSNFLLSTNYFETNRGKGSYLTYNGFDGPILCNPLAVFRDS